jgi:hypothetical protein
MNNAKILSCVESSTHPTRYFIQHAICPMTDSLSSQRDVPEYDVAVIDGAYSLGPREAMNGGSGTTSTGHSSAFLSPAYDVDATMVACDTL